MKTRAIRPSRRRRRRGFSLIEIMVAMTLLSIVLMSLARISFTVAARGRTNDIVAKRNAVLVQEANKFNAMTFANIRTFTKTNVDLEMGDFSFNRRVTFSPNPATATATEITIVITPALDPARKDSVIVNRVNPPGSPLCVGC
jgi:prepilin-type N-terminal cleavage/methylation domain-containing protein